MIKIGICDDEKGIVESIKEMITQFAKENHWEVSFAELYSGEELIALQEKLDLLFLDIEMPGMDGIEAGTIFRKRNSECKIAMVTSMEGRMKESFDVEPFCFVSKPIIQVKIEETLKKFAERMIGYGQIMVYQNRKAVYLTEKDIILMQAINSSTEFQAGGQIYRSEISLTALEEELEEKLFVRVSRKYIINLAYVEKYEKGVVYIASRKIKVPKERKNLFEDKWREYDLRYR